METTMRVQGMTCGGCVASVTRVLKAIDGVKEVDVKLDPGEARVTYDAARTRSTRRSPSSASSAARRGRLVQAAALALSACFGAVFSIHCANAPRNFFRKSRVASLTRLPSASK